VDGILNINKPCGKTSFSIVSLVRRLSGERRVGHAGTLDPVATGVLPVCLGQGTRVVQFLLDATKAYRAEIEFGVATDTYDATGSIITRGDPSGISREQLLLALNSFCGLISQTPPMYSAVKHGGKPLYQLARSGIQVERKSRLTWIYHLELIDWQPPVATIEVECGKGTYIRSLAHDLGQLLGCGANLKSLTRLRCGCFDIEDAVSLPQLEDAFRYGYWQRFIYPIDVVLLHWAAMVVGDATEQDIRHGRPLVFDRSSYGNHCRVYTRDGHFLAVLEFDSEKRQWQPEKVFSPLINS
jgi:tRNA pseudouridine55 synthase